MLNPQEVLNAMVEYFGSDIKRINHFIKVYSFARLIGEAEGLDDYSQNMLEITALVHDIGIKPSEEKYHSSAGKYQELEGPPEAERLLRSLGAEEELIRDVCYIVGHHHTYTDIDTLPYQILVEADFLVNLYEDSSSRAAAQTAYDRIFRTQKGRQLMQSMYL